MNKRMRNSALRWVGIPALFGLGAIGSTALHAQTTTASAPMQWTKVSVELPVGDVLFPDGDGAQIANGYCLMCHSAGMVLRQPPLTQPEWLAEIRKMRAFWGAPMPADQDEALARYLVRVNGRATGK